MNWREGLGRRHVRLHGLLSASPACAGLSPPPALLLIWYLYHGSHKEPRKQRKGSRSRCLNAGSELEGTLRVNVQPSRQCWLLCGHVAGGATSPSLNTSAAGAPVCHELWVLGIPLLDWVPPACRAHLPVPVLACGIMKNISHLTSPNSFQLLPLLNTFWRTGGTPSSG